MLFFYKDINRTYITLLIFMIFYKILSLLWSFLLKTQAHNSLFIFWGLHGHFASQCAKCSDFGPGLCWAACLRLLHLCLRILQDHGEPCCRSSQLLSRLGLKESNQSPSHPDQLLWKTSPVRICLPLTFWCKIAGNIFPQLRIHGL